MTAFVQNEWIKYLPRILPVFAIIYAVFSASQMYAQTPDEVIRVNTELTAFEATVTDKNGRPVRNLSEKDFRIFEDGVERSLEFFQPIKQQIEGRPLSLVFALDVSGSMTPEELEKLRASMHSFTKRLADYNSYFAVTTFAMEVKTIQSFTNRPDKLEKSFTKLTRDQQGLSTHAYDAVDEAIRLLEKKSPKVLIGRFTKRAVILITDGFPVGDIVSPETVIERANLAETSVYSVILPSYSRLLGTQKPLLTPLEASGLIEKTGGKSFYANEKSFDPLFEALAEEITASYALAFYPREENRRDGKFHKVRIETKSGLVVKQNRPGYSAQQ
ncbi:MAG: VWA domain-containing protein [Pyrinomonadaceae bacterium]